MTAKRSRMLPISNVKAALLCRVFEESRLAVVLLAEPEAHHLVVAVDQEPGGCATDRSARAGDKDPSFLHLEALTAGQAERQTGRATPQ